MTNHPNRGWRGRWTVDAGEREARHGPSGLVVRFQRRGAAWDGHVDDRLAKEISEAFIERHGAAAAALMIARLMREAGEVFTERMRND